MKNETEAYAWLNSDSMKESMSVLQSILSACGMYAEGGASWNRACRDNGLEPIRTRKAVIALCRCHVDAVPIAEMDCCIYDGYERFYQAVFGDHALRHTVFPPDYKECVMYVIQNNGLDDREVHVMIRRFGLDGDAPQTLESLGRDMERDRERIRQIEAKALRKCRMQPGLDILKSGLEKYLLEAEQKREAYRQEIRQAEEEHRALMEKMEKEHENRMDAIASNTYDDACWELLPDKLSAILSGTDISELGLSVRSYNMLRRAGKKDLLSVLVMDRDALMGIRNLGPMSVNEVMDRMEEYLRDKYGITPDTARVVCFSGRK